MKQLKFLKNIITEDGIPVWYENMLYQVSNEDNELYKLFCEDMKMRKIEKDLEHKIFEVINNE